MKQSGPGTSLGQTLFVFGILISPAGGGFSTFSCARWITIHTCLDNEGNEQVNFIGLAIIGIGIGMFIVGWLLMKEETVRKPSSPSGS